ncbi:MAG: EAL domain-containing protein [Candidatus Sedimenticola sp. (ex Thyasira tokunagai)]
MTQPASATLIRHYALILITAWSLIMSGLWYLDVSEHKDATRAMATTQARAHFKKDTAFRRWATLHGRLYVPVGKHYQPEPLLADIPERDITTPSGLQLSLINPARIIRQLDEKFSDLYGVSGRIRSLTPLRPGNQPDAWEKKALEAFQRGVKEVTEFTEINGEPHLRLMQPLTMVEGCLLCHKKQGYKLGDTGGGVGIVLPMRELLAAEREALQEEGVLFSLIWLLGVCGIALGYFYLQHQVKLRRTASEAVISSEKRKSGIMEAALDCIVTIDSKGRILEFNPAAEKTFGYQREQVVGQQMAELLVPPGLREHHRSGMKHHMETGEYNLLGNRVETTAMRSDGSEFPAEITVSRIDLGDEILFTAYIRDITAAQYLTEQLSYQASHDSLTSLINRHTFEQHLKELTKSSSSQQHHCLLYIDLDRFKVINDSSGHAAGDELLRQLSLILLESVRASDLLARLGGDEFGLLLERCSLEKGEKIASTILDQIRNYRFHWQDKIFTIGASIGLMPMSDLGVSHSELLSAADAACYKAKEEGRNQVYVFQPDDEELAQRRGEMGWISHIQTAFEEGRFQLYKQDIQPISGREAGDRAHYEILLRMLDRGGEVITPGQFIPAAERYQFMPTIDRWVIKNTFSYLASLDDLEEKVALCSINLSGCSITDLTCASFIEEQLVEYGIPPGIICFEVTETTAISNLSKAIRFMERLHTTGCLFALDDFGSGMSSFGYLKNLPVDFLKIDGEFVRDMVSDDISRAMVRSINEIGQVMGKKTIAEYVENREIMAQLKVLGVDYAQGYAVHKPEPLTVPMV